MPPDERPLPTFNALYAPDDGVIAARLLETAHLSAEQNQRIDRNAATSHDSVDEIAIAGPQIKHAIIRSDHLAKIVAPQALP